MFKISFSENCSGFLLVMSSSLYSPLLFSLLSVFNYYLDAIRRPVTVEPRETGKEKKTSGSHHETPDERLDRCIRRDKRTDILMTIILSIAVVSRKSFRVRRNCSFSDAKVSSLLLLRCCSFCRKENV